MILRPARPDEALVLTDLAMRSKRSNGYDAAFMAACRHELTVCPSHLARAEYWLAEIDVVCGFACLAVHDGNRAGEIDAFFIDPDWQRKGVGRALWSKLLERARSMELDELVVAADPAAVAFYEAMGFRIIGQEASGSIPGRLIPRMQTRVIRRRTGGNG